MPLYTAGLCLPVCCHSLRACSQGRGSSSSSGGYNTQLKGKALRIRHLAQLTQRPVSPFNGSGFWCSLLLLLLSDCFFLWSQLQRCVDVKSPCFLPLSQTEPAYRLQYQALRVSKGYVVVAGGVGGGGRLCDNCVEQGSRGPARAQPRRCCCGDGGEGETCRREPCIAWPSWAGACGDTIPLLGGKGIGKRELRPTRISQEMANPEEGSERSGAARPLRDSARGDATLFYWEEKRDRDREGRRGQGHALPGPIEWYARRRDVALLVGGRGRGRGGGVNGGDRNVATTSPCWGDQDREGGLGRGRALPGP